MATSHPPLTGLAQRLVDDGVLPPRAAREALDAARRNAEPLLRHLLRHGLAEPDAIAMSASREFGVPAIDMEALDPDALAGDIDEELIRRHNILPLVRRGNTLHVAIADPADVRALDAIKFAADIDVEPVVAAAHKLRDAIERYLSREPAIPFSLDHAADNLTDEVSLEAIETDPLPMDEAEQVDDTPIVRFVNRTLTDAIRTGASDIHFEPYASRYRVRFRTDGILREVSAPPQNLANRLAARLKVMAALDISERRVPQDGRIKMTLSETHSMDLRMNTLPTLFGEKIVLRILDQSSARIGIEALGFEPEQERRYRSALARPQGMILVTGPTGSGKTVTLYAGLNLLNDPTRNIATAEDPVEMHIDGINQVHVNARVGLDFATALRSFLRQDPDVVMIGEIRDLETAEMAVKAAQTGHLVLSTLHTNSAAQTLTRMRNMGVAAFNLATSVSLVIAQRLARLLCPECKRPIDVPAGILLREGFAQADVDGGFDVFEANPRGCGKCRDGYRGRVGVYEVVEMTPEMSRIALEAGDIAEQARLHGFDDLRAAGLKKVARGATSLAEINRITLDRQQPS
ncbi:MAG: type IV-A pilus assembly ATPase PilB [Gammaproteobacteria bacterium]|nr:type IV-A pilus assembly ATPase PilB [Gammaproteobacteria bacterium]